MKLSICTFMWGTKYTHEHVLRLGRMLRRNLTIDYQYVLISDQAPHDQLLLEGEDGAPHRYIPLWHTMRDAKLCGVRIPAFSGLIQGLLGDRFCWVDLDVVITGNVDHIFGRTEPFVALATPQGPLWYNGSFVMMDAGSRSQVLERWTPEAYAALPAHYEALGMRHGGQSDEGWMTYVLGPGEATVGEADGIRYFKHISHLRNVPQGTKMVVMNGRRFDPSMRRLQERHPWLLEHWR